MYCPNCNAETNENVLYCEKCGTELKKGLDVSMSIRRMSKKKMALVILGMLVSVMLVYILIPKIPNEEQIKKDIKQNILTKEDVITKMSIVQEEKTKRTYDIVVSVVYEDESVEYKEKYRVLYSKGNKWEFTTYEDNDTKTWEMKAIAEPSDDALRELTPKLYDIIGIKMEIQNKVVDLDKQTSLCTYVYRHETITRAFEWLVECQYEFDDGWQYVDYKCIEEKVVTNIRHSWEGTAIKYSESGLKNAGKDKIIFRIVSANEGVLTAEFTQGDVVHQMEGTYTEYSYDRDECTFFLQDVANEEYCFKGSIGSTDTVTGSLCTKYTSGYSFEIKSLTYHVELQMK